LLGHRDGPRLGLSPPVTLFLMETQAGETRAGRSVYIAPISWGLGDLIVSLPIVQALIDEGLPTYLVVRSSRHEGLARRMAGLSGVVSEESFLLHPDLRNRLYLNPREHPLQKDWWWGSRDYYARFGDRKINDLLAEICAGMGVRVDFDRLVPLEFRALAHVALAHLRDAVILIPGSDGVFKCWPAEHWLEIAKELSARGRRVVMLGQPERSEAVRALAGSIDLLDYGLTDSLDAISGASAVIGVDTGLMHLAVLRAFPPSACTEADPFTGGLMRIASRWRLGTRAEISVTIWRFRAGTTT
jgi:hypothetical protein